MNLAVQILAILRRPQYVVLVLIIAIGTSLSFLFLDQFYFISPYFAVYVDSTRVSILVLDVAISALSGIVLVTSIYEISTFPGPKGSYRRTGMAGVLAALVAGACPCYYLVPLLAVLGGVGGFLGAAGIFLNNYEFQIKFGTLVLLGFTTFTLERALRAACAIPRIGMPQSPT